MPQHMLEHSPNLVRMFFTEGGHVYQVDSVGLPTGVYLLQPLPNRTLPILLREAMGQPSLFGGHESREGFIDLVGRLLTLDPHHRPTATAAMEHGWLAAQTVRERLSNKTHTPFAALHPPHSPLSPVWFHHHPTPTPHPLVGIGRRVRVRASLSRHLRNRRLWRDPHGQCAIHDRLLPASAPRGLRLSLLRRIEECGDACVCACVCV